MGKYGISESDSFFACLLLVKDNVKPGVSDGRQDMLRGIQFPLTLSGSSYKDDTCYIAKEKMSRKQYLSVGQLRGWCCRIQKVPKSCKLKAATYFSKHSQVCCTLRQTNENPPKINAKKKRSNLCSLLASILVFKLRRIVAICVLGLFICFMLALDNKHSLLHRSEIVLLFSSSDTVTW